jgi:hypothetical protein
MNLMSALSDTWFAMSTAHRKNTLKCMEMDDFGVLNLVLLNDREKIKAPVSTMDWMPSVVKKLFGLSLFLSILIYDQISQECVP